MSVDLLWRMRKLAASVREKGLVVNAKFRSRGSTHDDKLYLVGRDLSALFTTKAEEDRRDERCARMDDRYKSF
jgi:hypothetical protein